ncbi:MAG: DUF4469 domain-containing protein [Planctomycetaceae bacterium]|jgi:hypothetical protein|nr:DUF4469 domain-containing protein [Planctomycetaceae bacterium]
MAKQNIWKAWLRPNLLTKDAENDNFAEISTVGNTLHNEDVARHIVKERSELRYETILSILNERDTVVRDTVLAGSSVQDGNIRLAPRITGNWIGSAPVFNPKEHKITVDAIPTVEFRKALEDVGVEILGKKTGGGAIIGLVTDVLTGKTDGTVTVNGDIIIEGEKIKIEPISDTNLGVFFTDTYGSDIGLDYPLIENTPKKIICRLPMLLGSGNVYTLKIVTRFAGSIPLKTPRIIVYELPITVISPLP